MGMLFFNSCKKEDTPTVSNVGITNISGAVLNAVIDSINEYFNSKTNIFYSVSKINIKL